MYINIGANNGSGKLWTKNTATSGKLIKAVYVSYGYVYIFGNKTVPGKVATTHTEDGHKQDT